MKTVFKLQKGLLQANSLRESNLSWTEKLNPIENILNSILKKENLAPSETITTPDLSNSFGLIVENDTEKIMDENNIEIDPGTNQIPYSTFLNFLDKNGKNILYLYENFVERLNLHFKLYWPILNNKVFNMADKISITNPYKETLPDDIKSSRLASLLYKDPIKTYGFASSKEKNPNFFKIPKLDSISNGNFSLYKKGQFKPIDSIADTFYIERINSNQNCEFKTNFTILTSGMYTFSCGAKNDNKNKEVINNFKIEIKKDSTTIKEYNYNVVSNWNTICFSCFLEAGTYSLIGILPKNVEPSKYSRSMIFPNNLYIRGLQFSLGDCPSPYIWGDKYENQRPLLMAIQDTSITNHSKITRNINTNYSWVISYQRNIPLLGDDESYIKSSKMSNDNVHMECLGDKIRLGYKNGKLFYSVFNITTKKFEETIYQEDPLKDNINRSSVQNNWETVNIYPKKNNGENWKLIVEIIRNKSNSNYLNDVTLTINLDNAFDDATLKDGSSFFIMELFKNTIKSFKGDNIDFNFQMGSSLDNITGELKYYDGYYRDFVFFDNYDSFLNYKNLYMQVSREDNKTKVYVENIEEI